MSSTSSNPSIPNIPPPTAPWNPTPVSPKPRGLRKLHSTQALSQSAALNVPISAQSRLRQQRSVSAFHKDSLNNQLSAISSSRPFGRARSNSDASTKGPPTVALPIRRGAGQSSLPTPTTTPKSLDIMLRHVPAKNEIPLGIQEIKTLVLAHGVPSDSDGMSTSRIYLWLIFLSAPSLPTDNYLGLIHRGPSPAYSKIRNDTFRTLATDPLFRRRVSEASLIRLLNAVAWRLHDAKEERNLSTKNQSAITTLAEASPELHPVFNFIPSAKHARGPPTATTTEGSEAGSAEPGTYVQGMNVLAAPFLYAARSEVEAFVAFHRFLTEECPGYVRGAMEGVHRGLSLVDRVLAIVDPALSAYLLSKGMQAKLYAFPSVLTLCACTPPLPEVLHLWDFLFASGAHMNVLCIVAQLIMTRDAILESPSPMKVLRSFPPLQASKIKWLAISILDRIPNGLYDEIVDHAK
ncbi:putative mitotic check point protein [Xylona heveae TC161]|uniref:Putative mitotic check point protein n=1 Tax=Xylona heveae (strain CBS 132557 / TC161) TaxID=1328760 RepID=A0A165J8J9_XYLHT|nr:putative mitotic check point protein [Xylona heveae TC161]KZF25895.1 putative mitotic check point protein [Xylona heveae TC161]